MTLLQQYLLQQQGQPIIALVGYPTWTEKDMEATSENEQVNMIL